MLPDIFPAEAAKGTFLVNSDFISDLGHLGGEWERE